MSTQRFGCGVGAAVAEETHERIPDAELWFRLARGLQAAADAATLLALRAERDAPPAAEPLRVPADDVYEETDEVCS